MFTTKTFSGCILSIVGSFVILQAIRCSKEGSSPSSTCPAFSDPVYDAWFPYHSGQVIRFKNAAGAENTITIDRIAKTPELSYYPTLGGSCSPKVNIFSAEPGPSSILFRLEYSYGDFESLSIALKTALIHSQKLSDTGLVIRPVRFSESRFFTNLNLNGTNYSDVQMIIRDTITNKNAEIYKVFIAKKLGVLAYEEFPSLALWIKQ